MAAVRAVAMAEAMATMRNHPTNPVCPFDPAPSEHMPARVDRRTSKLTNRAPRLTSTPAGMQRGRDDVVGSPTPPPPMRAGAAIAAHVHNTSSSTCERKRNQLTNRAPRLTSTPAGMQRGRDDVVR